MAGGGGYIEVLKPEALGNLLTAAERVTARVEEAADLADTLNAATTEVQGAARDAAREALALTGISPAYISETTALPPLGPNGTRGAWRLPSGGWQRGQVVTGAWSAQGDPLVGRGEVAAVQESVEVVASRQYTAERFGGDLQATLNATPAGATADLALGGPTTGIVTDGERSITGRGIYGPVVLVADEDVTLHDDFERPAGPLGDGWALVAGPDFTTTGTAAASSNNGYARYVGGAVGTTGSVRATVSGTATAIIARYQDNANRFTLVLQGGQVTLNQTLGGVFTPLGTWNVSVGGATSDIRLDYTPSTVSAWFGGTLLGEFSNAVLADVAGVGMFSAGPDSRLHDFSVVTPTGLTRDAIMVQPPADGNQRAGTQISNLLVYGQQGRHALHINLLGTGRRLTRLHVHHVHCIAGAHGEAFRISNDLAEIDAISNSRIEHFTFDGGATFYSVGDSMFLGHGVITGKNGLVTRQNTVNPARGGADASIMTLLDINSTAENGWRHETGTRVHASSLNWELPQAVLDDQGNIIKPAGVGTDGAMINWVGGPTAAEAIENGTLTHSYLAPITPGIAAVRWDNTNHCTLDDLTITAAADTYAVLLTPNTKNAMLGRITWHCTPGKEVDDQGVGTMGLRKTMPSVGGRVAVANRLPPRFIKRPDARTGVVELSGSVGGGGVAANSLIDALPVGFRIAQSTYAYFPARYVTDGGAGVTYVLVNPDGSITLSSTLPGSTLVELDLGQIRYESAFV